MTKPAPPREPDGYFYETESYFGVHRSFTDEYYNGRRPDRTIPYWLSPPPTAAAVEPAQQPPPPAEPTRDARKLLRDALDSLEYVQGLRYEGHRVTGWGVRDQRIDAIRAYLAAAPAAESVAQQPPPREHKVRCIACGEGWATTTADDVCDRCRAAPTPEAPQAEPHRRIPSDPIAPWFDRAKKAEAELAASREREAQAYERAAKAVEQMPMPPGGFNFRALAVAAIRALASPDSAPAGTGETK